MPEFLLGWFESFWVCCVRFEWTLAYRRHLITIFCIILSTFLTFLSLSLLLVLLSIVASLWSQLRHAPLNSQGRAGEQCVCIDKRVICNPPNMSQLLQRLQKCQDSEPWQTCTGSSDKEQLITDNQSAHYNYYFIIWLPWTGSPQWLSD